MKYKITFVLLFMFRKPEHLIFLILLMQCSWVSDSFGESNKYSFYHIKSIEISGNKKTRPDIILRDLAFKQGDSFEMEKMADVFDLSKRLLLNLHLFNEVRISADSFGVIKVHVQESWYIWPMPILQLADRNFNEWWNTRDPGRLDLGLSLMWFNFSGRNDLLTVNLNSGYTHRLEFGYSLPFIDRKKRWGMGMNAYYSANKEVWAYPENDRMKFFSSGNDFLINRKGAGLNFIYRQKFFTKHIFGIAFQNIQVNDTIVSEAVNPDFLFEGKSMQNDMMLYYQFIHDKRDYRGYPLKGYVIKYLASMTGYHSENIDLSNVRLKTGIRIAGFQPFRDGWYGGAAVSGFVSNMANPPYRDFRALGYRNDFVRGYEPFVIDGKDFLLFRSSIRKAILKDSKFKTWKKLPSSYRTAIFSMFAGVHYDAGYVNSPIVFEHNQLPNKWLNGWGVGIDFVFYYNNVLRMEYSFNQMGGRNLYIHFYAPVL